MNINTHYIYIHTRSSSSFSGIYVFFVVGAVYQIYITVLLQVCAWYDLGVKYA